MRMTLDCVPCFLKQALIAVRAISDDPGVHQRFLREMLREAAAMDLTKAPPAMARRLHRRIREWTGCDDPYRERKEQLNALALWLLDRFRSEAREAADPFDFAVRLAIAGNVMDLGPNGSMTDSDLRASVERTITEPLVGDPRVLRDAARNAGRILYLTDNAGEVALDRPLIEQLGTAKVTVAVRGRPVTNDATMDDARAVGLTDMVEVIDNGSDAPGTLLEICGTEFRERFEAADLVVSKGQGNYESLVDCPRDVWFLFKVKCAVVAALSGLPIGANVVLAPEGR